MVNTLITNDMIAKMGLAEFENIFVLAHMANQSYSKEFNSMTGNTIRLEKPVRYRASTGRIADVQGIEVQSTTLGIKQQFNITVELTSAERLLDIGDFHQRVVRPAMQRLANQIEEYVFGLMHTNVANTVGTVGSPINSVSRMMDGQMILNGLGVIPECVALNVSDYKAYQSGIFDNRTMAFNNRTNDELAYRGYIDDGQGLKITGSQNILPFSETAAGGTPLVNGASQSGSSLVTDGWTAGGTIPAGTKIQIANVYLVNPLSQTLVGQDSTFERWFVVTEDVTVDGSGNATLPIFPSISATAPYNTVNALPADNAAITVISKRNSNFMWGNDGVILSVLELGTLSGMDCHIADDPDTGYAIRVCQQGNILTDKEVIRFDVLVGTAINDDYMVELVS